MRYDVIAEVGDPQGCTRRIRTQIELSPHETFMDTLEAIVALQQHCPRYWVQIDSVVEVQKIQKAVPQ